MYVDSIAFITCCSTDGPTFRMISQKINQRHPHPTPVVRARISKFSLFAPSTCPNRPVPGHLSSASAMCTGLAGSTPSPSSNIGKTEVEVSLSLCRGCDNYRSVSPPRPLTRTRSAAVCLWHKSISTWLGSWPAICGPAG